MQSSRKEDMSSDSEAAEQDLAPQLLNEENRFFSRLLTKEGNNDSNNGYSCRIYYTTFSGRVPFLWEAEPGKPRAPATPGENALPPLSPPPSHQATACLKSCSSSSDSSSSNPRFILQKMKNILHCGGKFKRSLGQTRGKAWSFDKAAAVRNSSAGCTQSCWMLAPSVAGYRETECKISESSDDSDLSKSSLDSSSEFGESCVSFAISEGTDWSGPLPHRARVLSGGTRHPCLLRDPSSGNNSRKSTLDYGVSTWKYRNPTFRRTYC